MTLLLRLLGWVTGRSVDPLVTINVKPIHLQLGQRLASQRCPVALAVKDVFPHAEQVTVTRLRVTVWEKDNHFLLLLPVDDVRFAEYIEWIDQPDIEPGLTPDIYTSPASFTFVRQ